MNRPYPLYEQSREYENMREMVADCGARFADRVAFSYRTRPFDEQKVTVTFREFARQVEALGTEMLARGMAQGHVCLIGKLSYGWILTYFATLSIGAVLVPLDPEWTADDLAATARTAEVSALVCEGGLSEKADRIAAACGLAGHIRIGDGAGESLGDLIAAGEARLLQGDDAFRRAPVDREALALLVFTSGTTGQGKGVMHNQRALTSNIAGGLRIATIGKKVVGVLPPHHTFGSTVGILATVCLGGELYLSSGVKYLPRELQTERPDSLLLVPLYLETFARKIRAAVREKGKERMLSVMMALSGGLRRIGMDLRKQLFASVRSAMGGELNTVICGGAPLSRDIYDFFTALGVTVMNGYGITECAPLVSVNRNRHIVPGSVGMPIPCDTVKIDRPDENGEGEICVKGPNVMMGYYRNPEATREAIDPDGYFHTGDIGKLDAATGYIRITGRMKNLIILSNGKNVYPEEIEGVLSAVPGVSDVVVYEGQSRRGVEGNRIVAEFYPDPDFRGTRTAAEMEAYLRPYVEEYDKTAVPYKKIGLIRVREEPFPKNTLRKIMRFRIDRSID